MPLPTENVLWPPPAHAKLLHDVRTHAAWWSGDRATLASLYGRAAQAAPRPSERAWFWAKGTGGQEPGKPDTRLHVPLAADIATTSADLLFSEPPTFTVQTEATQARLDAIVDGCGLINTLLEAAEVQAALGGVYLKADWDSTFMAQPVLTTVHEDAAVPEWRWGRLSAVTFWKRLPSDATPVLRYLERHDAGQIGVGLYEGTETHLGRVVPLTDHPETAGLVDGLTDGNVKQTGVPMITAWYVPNMRPNRKYRGADSGRSDYQGVEDIFDALDEAWTSWMRDLRLGRGRLTVPESYLQSEGRGRGASFDADREVYAALQMPPTGSNGASNITATQFAIRVDEHSRTAHELTRLAISTAGYSGQTFGLTGEVAVTATEVTARERKSFITRDKKTRYWRPELTAALECLLALDRALGFTPGLAVERPLVEFPDGVSEDPLQVATTLEMLHRAQAISTQEKVARLNPDWDEPRIDLEVAAIMAQTGQAVPDPADEPV